MNDLINPSGKMTSIQIAEITGKSHNDVMKSIRKMEETWVKLDQGNFSLISYFDKRNRPQPMYELTKTECLYIATKFNDEARAKLIIRWEQLESKAAVIKTPSELLLENVQLLVQTEKRVSQNESRIKALEAKNTLNPDYFTVAGYGTLNNIPVNLKLASQIGRKATKICNQLNIPTDSIPDPRYGRVKLYPTHILKQVFEQLNINP